MKILQIHSQRVVFVFGEWSWHEFCVGCTTCVALLEGETERANDKTQYVLEIIVIMVDRVLQGWSCMVP